MKISIGDPVTINEHGHLIKWTEDCGRDLLGILPQGTQIIDGYIIVPTWFSYQLYSGCCQ